MKGLKFVETLRVTFKKLANDEIVYKTAYLNSKAQTIINNTEIPEALQLSKQQILNMIAQWVSEGSGWTIENLENRSRDRATDPQHDALFEIWNRENVFAILTDWP